MRTRSLRSTQHILAAGAVALLTAVAPLGAQDSTAAAPKGSGKWSASIGSLTGIRGAADVRVEARNDKESRARLTVRSTPINRQIAWDIVAGSCGDDGRPVAAAAAFRRLLTRNDGGGDAMATFPRLESGKRYYVRVFDPQEPPADRSGFGCANLSEES